MLHLRKFNENVILYDILGGGLLTESLNFQQVLDKVKHYAKKGLITTAILTSLMSNSAFSEEQRNIIKDAAEIEMISEVGGEEVSAKELKKKLKGGDWKGADMYFINKMIKDGFRFKLFNAFCNTESCAQRMATSKAGDDIKFKPGTNPAYQAKILTRDAGNQYEALIIIALQ